MGHFWAHAAPAQCKDEMGVRPGRGASLRKAERHRHIVRLDNGLRSGEHGGQLSFLGDQACGERRASGGLCEQPARLQ